MDLKKLQGLVRQQTIPTERPPFVGEVSAKFSGYRVSRGQRNEFPRPLIRFSRPEPLLSFQVAPHLSPRGWVDPVPDPLLLKKNSSAGNQTQDLCSCSQEPWPLEHRGGLYKDMDSIIKNVYRWFEWTHSDNTQRSCYYPTMLHWINVIRCFHNTRKAVNVARSGVVVVKLRLCLWQGLYTQGRSNASECRVNIIITICRICWVMPWAQWNC
jgi:hypothetical protein